MKSKLSLVFLTGLSIFFIGCGESKTNKNIQTSSIDTTIEYSSFDVSDSMKLKIYVADDDAESVVVSEEVIIQDNLSLIEKLNVIAEKTSLLYFGGLKIKVDKVDAGIAYINLIENKVDDGKNQNVGWMNYLNGGSTNGIMTFEVLTENFFQRDIKSDWITGIQILYNGKVMDELDHFSSVGVIMK